MLPDSDDCSRFFFLFPLYCLTDVRVAGETLMAIPRRTIPTCLPHNNQFCIGQNNRLCLQIVWHPSRRRMVGGVLGSPSLCLVADGQARMPAINGRTATPAEGRIIRGYTMGFDSPHLRISPGLSPQPTGTGREGRQGAADGRRRGRCPLLSLSSEFALQGSLTGQ